MAGDGEGMDEATVLYRPVGLKELDLIRESGYAAFPPRLPDQPIFYPVLSKEYATKIARDWNVKYNSDGCGFVTTFRVRRVFLERYEVQKVAAPNIRNTGFPPKSCLSSTRTSSAR
jgi:hypothetical protein